MSFNYPANIPFYEFLNRLEVKMAKIVHVRDDCEELVSFKPQKFSLVKEYCWLRNYTVVESRFDAETEELFIKIV